MGNTVLCSDMKISLLSLRRRAELSAAEASGSVGDHWFPDFPGAREDLPRERREGVPWCGKLAARGEGWAQQMILKFICAFGSFLPLHFRRKVFHFKALVLWF